MHTYGMARLGAYGENGTKTVYVYDGQGSVAQTAVYGANAGDAAGASVESYRYTPYGELIAGDQEAVSYGYYYNGEAYDPAAGSYYLRARYYEPSLLRFGQPDPAPGRLTDPLSWNRYVYGADNPVRYADPSGENPFLVAFGVAFASIAKTVASGIQNQAETYLKQAQQNQKTTDSIVKFIQASAGVKAVTDALKKNPLGYILVKTGEQLVKVVTESQAQAVTQAQTVYNAVSSSDSASIKSLNEKLLRACQSYLKSQKDTETKAKKSFLPDLSIHANAAEAVAAAPALWDLLVTVATTLSIVSAVTDDGDSNKTKGKDTADPDTIPEVDIDDLPENVQDAYEKYEKGKWKGKVKGQNEKTRAGGKYRNDDKQLPTHDTNGNEIEYKEWDVNNASDEGRDAERFVTGSDGSVYYTDSHYGQGTSPSGLPPFIKIK